MFVAQAHSFAQQARLAITLAWVAGYTNIITVLMCATVTSHVSGTTSNLGRDVVEGLRGTDGAWILAGFAAYLLTTFVAGAILSGFTTELGRRRGWNSIYVLPMALQAVLLTLFTLTLRWFHGNAPATDGSLYWISGIASMAMGLQNATITRISSGVVRTTHVTGVLTDLGLECAQFFWWMRDRDLSKVPTDIRSQVRHALAQPVTRRLALLLSIMGSFALGAGLGTLSYDFIRPLAMVPPVAFLLLIVWMDVIRPIAAIEPSDLVANGTESHLPPGLGVFCLRQDPSRIGGNSRRKRLHSLPNLVIWADQLSPELKVVILDLSDVSQLDGDAAFQIRALLASFRTQGRHLVLAGVTREQYQHLAHAGAAELLDPMSVCSDFDIALGRGLALLEELGEHPA